MPNYKDIACPRSTAKESRLQAKKKTIFDAAAKIGKLEFLNDFGVGGGTTRKALEQVAIASDAIRVGDTSTDTTGAGGLLDDSGSGLMSSMGLDGAVQTAVAAFDPNAVNGAVGASKSIVARAKQGNFRMEDIPTAIAEFKNIAQIAGKIFKPPLSGDGSTDYQKFKCRPSPYATDLVHRAPKQNFQFVVEISLNPAYLQSFVLAQAQISDDYINNQLNGVTEQQEISKILRANSQTSTPELPAQLAFLVKTSGRPSVTYEYEDLNYYNYRTKGIRKATFNPISMSFIDDQLNSAAHFYAFYLSAMSPIANLRHSREENSYTRKNHEQIGMNFNDFQEHQKNSPGSANTFPAYASTIGALKPSEAGESNRTRRVIDRISIYQYGKNGNTFTAYNMFAPRITGFSPSELTMADSGDGQSLSMDIDYDYFTIQPELKIGSEDMSGDAATAMAGGDAGALFPNRYFGSEDIASNSSDTEVSPGGNALAKVGALFGL